MLHGHTVQCCWVVQTRAMLAVVVGGGAGGGGADAALFAAA